MALTYVTGPVQIYVGLYRGEPSSSGGYGGGFRQLLEYPTKPYIQFLGTCEAGPQFEFTPHYKALIADANGGGFPFDVASLLETAVITMVLNRFNESVYQNLQSRPRSSTIAGEYAADDVGRLLMHEAYATPIWLHYPYYSKFAGFGMAVGMHFLATWPISEAHTPGTRQSKRLLQLQAIPVYNPATGGWKMYDEVMTHIPALPPVSTDGVLL